MPATTDGLLNPTELAAWRGMLRAHSEISRDLDAELLREHKLSLSSYEVLLFLADAPEGRLRMSELADGALLSRSGLTRLVDRLEREGLVAREQCPNDLRGYHAAITPAGRRRFDAARRTHLDGVRRMYLSRFSEDELAVLGEFMERVTTGAGAPIQESGAAATPRA